MWQQRQQQQHTYLCMCSFFTFGDCSSGIDVLLWGLVDTFSLCGLVVWFGLPMGWLLVSMLMAFLL
jgi:hypothetical protein